MISHGVTITCLLGLTIALIGCASPTETANTRPAIDPAEGRRVFAIEPEVGSAETEAQASAAGEPQGGGFTILLTGVPANMRQAPDAALEQVARAVPEPGVRLMEQTGDRPPLIVFGSYADTEAPAAQADLRRIRELDVDGRRPFSAAMFVPEIGVEPANQRLARHDLRQARQLYGDEAVYTLQIGMYAREDDRRPSAADLASFRKAAEDAVERLRREGDEAFFYHGLNGSMVTIGVFNDSDMDTSVAPPIESRRLEAVREKHPHNLLNGRGVRETRRGEDGSTQPRLQASRLVLIPD